MDDEARLIAICDLLTVADQFMCAHLKERCEIALALMVNAKTVKLLLPFAKANRTDILLRCCEHFERWGDAKYNNRIGREVRGSEVSSPDKGR